MNKVEFKQMVEFVVERRLVDDDLLDVFNDLDKKGRLDQKKLALLVALLIKLKFDEYEKNPNL